MDIDGLNGKSINGTCANVNNSDNKNPATSNADGREGKLPDDLIEDDVDDTEEEAGEEEEEEEEDTEDENEEIVDRIIEESPNKRFQKRNRRFPRPPPGVDEAFLALEPETGKEYIWNEIYVTHEEVETENHLLSIVKRLKKNYHPFLIRFYEIWISPAKKRVTPAVSVQSVAPQMPEPQVNPGISAVISEGQMATPSCTSNPGGGTSASPSAANGLPLTSAQLATVDKSVPTSLKLSVSRSAQRQPSQQPRKIVFITERLVEGTLKQYISNSIKTNRAWKRYVGQILSVLRFLNSYGLTHGHLTNDNIFLQSSGALKVGTFALDEFLSRKCVTDVTQNYAVSRYLAPEYFQQHDTKIGLSQKGDVYALGVLALEIAAWDPSWETLFSRNEKAIKETTPNQLDTLVGADPTKTTGLASDASTGSAEAAGAMESASNPKPLSEVTIGQMDREKVLNLLNLVTDVSQKKFIECCLRANPADRPSLRSLINHPAMIEVPSLRLLSAKVIVRTIRASVANSCALQNPPKGSEDKPKLDRDTNQKFTETLSSLVDELTGHLENDTIIVEIKFRRGNTLRQRTWKDFNFVDSTKKYLDDVRNGYYLLFGCKPPYHQGEQVDSESETLTASASANGLGKLFSNKLPQGPLSGQTSAISLGSLPAAYVSSRRGSCEHETVASTKGSQFDTSFRANDILDEESSLNHITRLPHSISEPQMRASDSTNPSVVSSSKPLTITDASLRDVETLQPPQTSDKVTKSDANKPTMDGSPIAPDGAVEPSDDASSQFRSISVKPNVSLPSVSHPTTLSSVLPTSAVLPEKTGTAAPRVLSSTPFIEDVSFGYHTVPIHPAFVQRQYSEPRHVINPCAELPYSLRGRHSEMGFPAHFIVNPSHELCYPTNVVCAVANTTSLRHPGYVHDVPSHAGSRSRLYSTEIYPLTSTVTPLFHSPANGEPVVLASVQNPCKQRKRVCSLGMDVFLCPSDATGTQMETELLSNPPLDGANVKSIPLATPSEHTQAGRLGHLNRLAEEPVEISQQQTLQVDINAPAKEDSDVEGLGISRIPLTPEANSSILEQFVDTDEEKGEEATSEVHLFAQRIDMERPRTVEISARAGEEKLVDYRHCIIELCEYSYVGCGRWQLSLHFYLLNEKMTEQIKRTVHSQHLAYDWHRADVIVKSLYSSGVIRKEQTSTFLRHIHLAAHNKPTRQFQVQEGEIGNEHKGRVDPNDLHHRLQVLSNLLMTHTAEEDYHQSRNYFTQPPGTSFQSLKAASKAVRKISRGELGSDVKVMKARDSHPDPNHHPDMYAGYMGNGTNFVNPAESDIRHFTIPSQPPPEAMYPGLSSSLNPPPRETASDLQRRDSSTSPLPPAAYFPVHLPPGYYYPGNMTTIPYGYATLSTTHGMDPHSLSPLSIPYVISPTGTLPAFYPSYVPPVEGRTVVYYPQPYVHSGFQPDVVHPASPSVSSPSAPLQPTVPVPHQPAVAQVESQPTTVPNSGATPNNENILPGSGSAQATGVTQQTPTSSKPPQPPSKPASSTNSNQTNVAPTATSAAETSAQDMSIDEMMQRFMTGEKHLPLSHLGYLVPKNPQCAVCDDHHYLHRTDVAIYLASPCYHCREYFAKKAGLTPLAFMNLHYEYKIPWPGFLMVRCGVPTTKYTVNQITDYDCKIRRREPCQCFPGQVLPPCTEFSWSYHRPKKRTSSNSDSLTGVPNTSCDNRQDKDVNSPPAPSSTSQGISQQKRHSIVKQDSQEDGASVKQTFARKEQTPDDVVPEVEAKEKISESSSTIPAPNASSTVVEDSSNICGGSFPESTQGNVTHPTSGKTGTTSAGQVPVRGQFSDWNVSQLSLLRVCHERHPAGGQTLCSHGILVPSEARDDVLSQRGKIELHGMTFPNGEVSMMHGRGTNSASPSTAGESTPGLNGCGGEMGGAAGAGKKKKKRVRKLSGLQQ